MKEYINLFYSIYLHLFLLFVFLSIFFWIIISKTESRVINKEMSEGVKNGLRNVKIPEKYMSQQTGNYLIGLFKGKDKTVIRNNDQLFKMNLIIIGVLLIGLIASIFVRYKFCGMLFDVGEVIGENIIILMLVGAIEYYFFTRVASKYVPVPPSYLPLAIKEEIQSL